jgi:hypothetical protein
METKRLIKDVMKEVINEIDVNFSTDEFEEGAAPTQIQANCNTVGGGYLSATYMFTDKKVSVNTNNFTVAEMAIVPVILTKFTELSTSYIATK